MKKNAKNCCENCKKEEGSSATDCVTDVTDVTDGWKEEAKRKFGNGLCNGCKG
ncbi:hypothetical protein QUA81_12650 [Microcoleus sp. F6_B4]